MLWEAEDQWFHFLGFCKKNDYLPITHEDMTRFNISLDDGVSMVLWSLENAIGGEIYVPRIPSYKLPILQKQLHQIKTEDRRY